MRLFVILTFILCKYLFSITSVNMLPKIVCTYISCLKVNGLYLTYGYTYLHFPAQDIKNSRTRLLWSYFVAVPRTAPMFLIYQYRSAAQINIFRPKTWMLSSNKLSSFGDRFSILSAAVVNITSLIAVAAIATADAA